MTDQFDLDFPSTRAEYFRAWAYAFFQAGNRRKKEHTLNFKIENFFGNDIKMTTKGIFIFSVLEGFAWLGKNDLKVGEIDEGSFSNLWLVLTKKCF